MYSKFIGLAKKFHLRFSTNSWPVGGNRKSSYFSVYNFCQTAVKHFRHMHMDFTTRNISKYIIASLPYSVIHLFIKLVIF